MDFIFNDVISLRIHIFYCIIITNSISSPGSHLIGNS
jgi:hypothetical protein